MGITVTGKLTKTPNQFQAGESTGFGLRIGVKFYNRETKTNDWTNYEAVVFARAGRQLDFYTTALVEGSIIEISGSGCQIKTFEGNMGPMHSISVLDAKLGYISISNESAPAPAPAKYPSPQDLKSEDIPF